MTRRARYRKHRQFFDEKVDPVLLRIERFENGLRFDDNVRVIPLDASQDMKGVTIRDGALTGDGALSTLSNFDDITGDSVGLVSHSEFSGITTTSRLYLISIDLTTIYSNYWDGNQWQVDQSTAFASAAKPLQRSSVVSIQNLIFFASGRGSNNADNRIKYTSVGVAWAEIASPDYRPKYLASFGDRLIAFQDYQDPQSLMASVDGDPTDFAGVGSYQTSLVDTPNHPIDALQGGAQIGSNILAVFRQRSIMRAFETGSILQPIGVVHWINGIGTESPFSISQGPGATFFLGHDKMVYMLSEAGLKPVGLTIYEELLDRIDEDKMGRIQGVYNPVRQEYWLAIDDGTTGRIYVLDTKKVLIDNREHWRYREFPATLPNAWFILGLTNVAL